MSFHVALLREGATIPRRNNAGDAGYDVYADAQFDILPGQRAKVTTGIAIKIPDDCYARIAPRSGLALLNGIDVLGGVVDSSYRGEIQVILMNHGSMPFRVEPGTRVAQLIFERIYTPVLLATPLDAFYASETSRGEKGFGSSGV